MRKILFEELSEDAQKAALYYNKYYNIKDAYVEHTYRKTENKDTVGAHIGLRRIENKDGTHTVCIEVETDEINLNQPYAWERLIESVSECVISIYHTDNVENPLGIPNTPVFSYYTNVNVSELLEEKGFDEARRILFHEKGLMVSLKNNENDEENNEEWIFEVRNKDRDGKYTPFSTRFIFSSKHFR